jgi:hypothetical protein
VTGGFAETLNADAQYMRVSRRSDGLILLEATFRNLPTKGKATLVLRRSYGNSDGTELVQLYNWASASYPYGSFTTVSSRSALPTSTTETRILISDISPYVDFNKTMYLRFYVTDVASGNELHLDQAYLQRGKHL